MLKLIGEVAIGLLAFVAIKDRIPMVTKPEPAGLTKTQRVLHHAKEGGVAAVLGMGAGVAWPITAPIGAYKVGKYCVEHRAEIVDTVKAAPMIARDKARSTTAVVSSWFTRDHQVKVAKEGGALDLVAAIADSM